MVVQQPVMETSLLLSIGIKGGIIVKHNSHGGYKGEYVAPEHKASTVRGSFTGDGDSAGVEAGLSARSDLESQNLDNVKYNNAVDPISGNPRQVPKPYVSKSVSEKGHDFDIC